MWEVPEPADLLRHRVGRSWWDVLERLGITLLVTREYEHLVLALAVVDGRPSVSYLQLPHPSGLAVDREAGRAWVASTRNPNHVVELGVVRAAARPDRRPTADLGRVLAPRRWTTYPGSLYLHDLALIGGRLHGNAVGDNAVVRFDKDGVERVWWPRSIDGTDGPRFGRNHLQLNSIAPGPDLDRSYFSASAAAPGRHRPGQASFPVDGRGVVFSGVTREPVLDGLTRPHSARLHQGTLWVDNSGYGQVGVARDGAFEVVATLPGWTRGLTFVDDVAFVGTSRVLPRFQQYAPGLDLETSVCGLHAVDTRTGEVLGSLVWPAGDQLFALDWLPSRIVTRLPFRAGARSPRASGDLFYSYETVSDFDAD